MAVLLRARELQLSKTKDAARPKDTAKKSNKIVMTTHPIASQQQQKEEKEEHSSLSPTTHRSKNEVAKLKAGYAALMLSQIPTAVGNRSRDGVAVTTCHKTQTIPSLESVPPSLTVARNSDGDVIVGEGIDENSAASHGMPPPTPQEELTRLRALHLLTNKNNKNKHVGQGHILALVNGNGDEQMEKTGEGERGSPTSDEDTSQQRLIVSNGPASPLRENSLPMLVKTKGIRHSVSLVTGGLTTTTASITNTTVMSPRGSILLPPLTSTSAPIKKKGEGGGSDAGMNNNNKMFVVQSAAMVEPTGTTTASLPAMLTRAQRAKAAKMRQIEPPPVGGSASTISEGKLLTSDEDEGMPSSDLPTRAAATAEGYRPNPRLSSKPVVNFAVSSSLVVNPSAAPHLIPHKSSTVPPPPFFAYNISTNHEAVAQKRVSPARGRLAHQVFASDPDYYCNTAHGPTVANTSSRRRRNSVRGNTRNCSNGRRDTDASRREREREGLSVRAPRSLSGGPPSRRMSTSPHLAKTSAIGGTLESTEGGLAFDSEQYKFNPFSSEACFSSSSSPSIPLEPSRSMFTPKPSLKKGCFVYEHGQMPPTATVGPDPLLLNSFLKGNPAPVNPSHHQAIARK